MAAATLSANSTSTVLLRSLALAISVTLLASSCAEVRDQESRTATKRPSPDIAPNSTIIPYIPVREEVLPVRNEHRYLQASPTKTTSPVVSPRRKLTIVVIGDSLTAPSSSRMRKFSDDRCEFIVDSDYGRTTSEAVDVLSEMSESLSGKSPSDTHYVIALGTNDGSQESSYRDKFDSVLKSIPVKSRVYWITTFRSAPLYSQFRAVSSVATESGRVYILDWASQLLANPSILKSDGVHLTDGGYRFRSDFVKMHTCDSPPS